MYTYIMRLGSEKPRDCDDDDNDDDILFLKR